MEGTRVCADLKKGDGTWSRDCTHTEVGETLENINGKLEDIEMGIEFDNADGKFQEVVPKFLPGGTWFMSARKTSMRGNLLCTELQCKDQSWNPTCISVEKDGQAFDNDDCSFHLAMC